MAASIKSEADIELGGKSGLIITKRKPLSDKTNSKEALKIKDDKFQPLIINPEEKEHRIQSKKNHKIFIEKLQTKHREDLESIKQMQDEKIEELQYALDECMKENKKVVLIFFVVVSNHLHAEAIDSSTIIRFGTCKYPLPCSHIILII